MEEKGFVTKRVAELLRKKGFDCKVGHYYADEEDEWYDVNNITAETKYEALNKALEYCLENLIR